MGYSSDILQERVTILNKVAPEQLAFGETTQYQPAMCVHANVTWAKGVKALNEGALDAYDTIMVRMRWNNIISRDSRIVYDSTTYQILSFHADKRENTIQITAQEIV